MARPSWDWENRIGRRVKLRDLHILSAVVRWGSMAKAASHLAMSQSAVSEAVANLESALEVRLLDRNSQGIEPTIYADALLKRGHAVFDELKQAINDIENLTDPTAGEVRLACPEFLSVGLVPAVIEQMSRQHPKFFVRVFELNTTTLEFRVLQERNVDLVLARVPANFVDDDLETEVLFEDPHLVIAGVQSRWARRRNIALSDLAHEAWTLPTTPLVRGVLQQAFEAHRLQPPSEQVTSNSILLRTQLVASGRFLSVLPNSVVANNAKEWSVSALPIELGVKSPPVTIVTLKNRTVCPAVQLFIQRLRAMVKPPDSP